MLPSLTLLTVIKSVGGKLREVVIHSVVTPLPGVIPITLVHTIVEVHVTAYFLLLCEIDEV